MVPFVIASSITTGAATTSLTSTPIGTITAGDAILVLLEFKSAPGTITLTDIASTNDWTKAVNIATYTNWDGSGRVMAAYILCNVISHAAYTVTVGTSNSVVTAVLVSEVAGGLLLTSAIVDNSATATGTSTAPASGNVTLANANELVVSMISTTATFLSGNTTLPTGYTVMPQLFTVNATAEALNAAWKVEPSSPVNPTWAITSTPTWGCMTFSLKFQNQPNLQFDGANVSGVATDTGASGAGPATALTGTAAATTSGSNVVNITDAVALGPVLLDGSAVLAINSPTSGRRYSRIINITGTSGAWVVTTQDTFANSETKNWAIGGKLLSMNGTNAATLWTANGARGGWTHTLNSTDSLSATVTFSALGDVINGNISIVGASEVVLVTIPTNTNIFSQSGGTAGYWLWANLAFQCTAGTKTSSYAVAPAANSLPYTFLRCRFGDSTNKLNSACNIAGGAALSFYDCEVKNTLSHGIIIRGLSATLVGVWIHDCGGDGINQQAATTTVTIAGCLITRNTGSGINDNAFAMALSMNSTVIDGNSGDGAKLSTSTIPPLLYNNQITNNTGIGLRLNPVKSQYANAQFLLDYNNFYGNGSDLGPTQANGPNDTSLNPSYVNSASNNWGIGNTSLAGKAFPISSRTIGANQSATVNMEYQGATQPAGGGGSITNVFIQQRKLVVRPISVYARRNLRIATQNTQHIILRQPPKMIGVPKVVRRSITSVILPGATINTTIFLPIRSRTRMITRSQYQPPRRSSVAALLVGPSRILPVPLIKRHFTKVNSVRRNPGASLFSSAVVVNQTILVTSPRKVR